MIDYVQKIADGTSFMGGIILNFIVNISFFIGVFAIFFIVLNPSKTKYLMGYNYP